MLGKYKTSAWLMLTSGEGVPLYVLPRGLSLRGIRVISKKIAKIRSIYKLIKSLEVDTSLEDIYDLQADSDSRFWYCGLKHSPYYSRIPAFVFLRIAKQVGVSVDGA